ncbi:MAG: hypothetical protein ACOZBL_06170 [Patescibacteria group bacterium]
MVGFLSVQVTACFKALSADIQSNLHLGSTYKAAFLLALWKSASLFSGLHGFSSNSAQGLTLLSHSTQGNLSGISNLPSEISGQLHIVIFVVLKNKLIYYI